MAKTPSRAKRGASSKASRKTAASKKTATRKTGSTKSVAAKRKAPKREVVSKTAIARAKRLEKLDAGPPRAAKKTAIRKAAASLKNPSFPNTYIQQVHVSLNDPQHAMTLSWTGPDAASQQTGPFHTSPGAGLRGFNCNDVATSRRSGSLCTPKGTFAVESFASHLNSDSRATYVTFFVRARGIALHYFPTVPNVAASHGCVRIQDVRIAQLIHDNARAGLTQVVVDGTWTKPPHQW